MHCGDLLDRKKTIAGNLRKFLKEQIEKVNPRRKLTNEENKSHRNLEAIADRLKCVENVQNRQLKKWLTEDDSAKI